MVPEYPAVASWEIVAALVEASKELGLTAHTGITWSLDAFYARNAIAGPDDSMLSMSVGGYWPSPLEARIRDMQQARILNCEMETGILLTLAGLFGFRAGAICVVSDLAPWPGPSGLQLDENMTSCIEVATRAMLRVAYGRRLSAVPGGPAGRRDVLWLSPARGAGAHDASADVLRAPNILHARAAARGRTARDGCAAAQRRPLGRRRAFGCGRGPGRMRESDSPSERAARGAPSGPVGGRLSACRCDERLALRPMHHAGPPARGVEARA